MLPADLVEQVLIRLPPDDPALLLRTATVCKDWCVLVSSVGFRRRLCEFHGTSPVLGVVCTDGDLNNFMQCAHFVPTSPPFRRPPVAGRRNWRAMDTRHGHVLLNKRRWGEVYPNSFAMWNPIKGEMRELLSPIPEGSIFWRAAVLYAGASAGGDACDDDDHLHCYHGPFQVVAIATDFTQKQARAHVYSSEARAWRVLPSQLQLADDDEVLGFTVPSGLVENALYFAFDAGTNLLKFVLVTQEMSTIRPPLYLGQRQFALATIEGGQLGFALADGCKLYLWSREARGKEGESVWTQSGVIELDKLLPAGALLRSPDVVASVDGMSVFFMLTSIEFQTGRSTRAWP